MLKTIMQMKKRILFITQDFARTGSEMMLWYLLKNLDPLQYAVSVFCVRKGILYDVLPEYVEKHVMYKSSPKWSDRMLRRVLKLFGIDPFAHQLNQIQKNFKADIWYVNTIAIPDTFDVAKQQGVKIVTHIHELLNAFSLIKAEAMRKTIAYSDVCICCSEVVCEKVAALNHADIRLQYSFVDTQTINVDSGRISAIKRELGILPSDFVWVVAGGANYMKGLDYVLPILAHFKDEPVKIIWIGTQFDNGLNYYVKSVADLQYPGRLIFTGSLSGDYYNYLSVANGFLLLSREESFSLVMIEAAYLGIPIVAFNVGIVKQFLKEGMGICIDSWNIEDFIAGMQQLFESAHAIDKRLLKEMAMLYSSEQQLPNFQALLSELFEDQSIVLKK